MTDDWDDGRGRSRHHRRSRRHRAREPQERVGREDPNLTPEERRYRQVRSIAERKTKLTGQAIRLGVIALVVLILTQSLWITALVVLCWGGSRMREFYRLVLEPRIREKFIAKEVRNQVQATLSQQRRALEGRHARSMEELSASIAHEIRNPITAAKSLVQQMGEDTSASENVEYAKVALGELDRVERSVSHLLRFARDEEMRMAELRMAEVIESALESFGDRIDRAGIRLETRIDGEGALTGDAEQLRRVVINLVSNAIDALEETRAADPRIDVEMGENLAGSEVWVRIRDNGPGIDADARDRIFSPLYTSKVKGTGLGLSITRKLVDAHGGTVELESELGRGTEFLVRLPRAPRKEDLPS